LRAHSRARARIACRVVSRLLKQSAGGSPGTILGQGIVRPSVSPPSSGLLDGFTDDRSTASFSWGCMGALCVLGWVWRPFKYLVNVHGGSPSGSSPGARAESKNIFRVVYPDSEDLSDYCPLNKVSFQRPAYHNDIHDLVNRPVVAPLAAPFGRLAPEFLRMAFPTPTIFVDGAAECAFLRDSDTRFQCDFGSRPTREHAHPRFPVRRFRPPRESSCVKRAVIGCPVGSARQTSRPRSTEAHPGRFPSEWFKARSAELLCRNFFCLRPPSADDFDACRQVPGN